MILRTLIFTTFVFGMLPGAGLHAAEKPAAMSLSALVATALAQNPEVQFYTGEIIAAKAGRVAAGRLANPELSLEVGRKSVRTGDASASGVAWAASLAQPFEWPGRLGLRKAIANSDITLAELGLSRFKNALAARVRILGYSLVSQQEKAAAAAEVADRLAALREVITQRDPAGITPLLEMKVIEATSIVVQKQAGDAAVAMQKALLELNQLMGRRAVQPLMVARTVFSFPAYPEMEVLLLRAAENNYDLRVRIRELEQQGLKVALAKNERYPSFTVGPQISQDRAGTRETTAGIALSLPLPLWNNGKASVTAAEARQLQAVASLMTTQREVERQVTEAALIYQTQRQRLAAWNADALESFRSAAALADRHYRLGAVEVATYIELQQKYVEATAAINESKAEALEAALKLEQLVGMTESLIKPAEAKPADAPKPKTKS